MRRAIFFFLLVANVTVAQQALFRVVDLDVGATDRAEYAARRRAPGRGSRGRLLTPVRQRSAESKQSSCAPIPQSSATQHRSARTRATASSPRSTRSLACPHRFTQ